MEIPKNIEEINKEYLSNILKLEIKEIKKKETKTQGNSSTTYILELKIKNELKKKEIFIKYSDKKKTKNYENFYIMEIKFLEKRLISYIPKILYSNFNKGKFFKSNKYFKKKRKFYNDNK
jgi:hypothetical protein